MPDLLRETFEAYALRAPSVEGLGEAVDARMRRDRARRRWTVAGAVATAAAAVAGVALVGPGPAERSASVVSVPAPPGTRWARWHGLDVAVPVAWDGFISCGAPVQDALVINDTSGARCLPQNKVPHLDVAWVAGPSLLGKVLSPEATDVTIDGVAAQRIVGETAEGQYAEAVSVPSHEAVVLVTSDDPAVAKRVLDTIRVRDVDGAGCVARPATLFPEQPPERSGATRQMVPDGVTDASVCGYTDGWVIHSRRASFLAGGLATTLNDLPVGWVAPTDEASEPGSAYVVTFRYARGPDVVVYLHWDSPRGTGITNGAVTGKLTDEALDAVVTILAEKSLG